MKGGVSILNSFRLLHPLPLSGYREEKLLETESRAESCILKGSITARAINFLISRHVDNTQLECLQLLHSCYLQTWFSIYFCGRLIDIQSDSQSQKIWKAKEASACPVSLEQSYRINSMDVTGTQQKNTIFFDTKIIAKHYGKKHDEICAYITKS